MHPLNVKTNKPIELNFVMETQTTLGKGYGQLSDRKRTISSFLLEED